jgi:hypothetical protein
MHRLIVAGVLIAIVCGFGATAAWAGDSVLRAAACS